MGTHIIGPNTVNLTINISKETKRELKKLAEESNITISAYIRGLLYEATRLQSIVVEERSITYAVKHRRPTKR